MIKEIIAKLPACGERQPPSKVVVECKQEGNENTTSVAPTDIQEVSETVSMETGTEAMPISSAQDAQVLEQRPASSAEIVSFIMNGLKTCSTRSENENDALVDELLVVGKSHPLFQKHMDFMMANVEEEWKFGEDDVIADMIEFLRYIDEIEPITGFKELEKFVDGALRKSAGLTGLDLPTEATLSATAEPMSTEPSAEDKAPMSTDPSAEEKADEKTIEETSAAVFEENHGGTSLEQQKHVEGEIPDAPMPAPEVIATGSTSADHDEQNKCGSPTSAKRKHGEIEQGRTSPPKLSTTLLQNIQKNHANVKRGHVMEKDRSVINQKAEEKEKKDKDKKHDKQDKKEKKHKDKSDKKDKKDKKEKKDEAPKHHQGRSAKCKAKAAAAKPKATPKKKATSG